MSLELAGRCDKIQSARLLDACVLQTNPRGGRRHQETSGRLPPKWQLYVKWQATWHTHLYIFWSFWSLLLSLVFGIDTCRPSTDPIETGRHGRRSPAVRTLCSCQIITADSERCPKCFIRHQSRPSLGCWFLVTEKGEHWNHLKKRYIYIHIYFGMYLLLRL